MAADWTTLAIALEFEDLQLTTHHQADSAATEVGGDTNQWTGQLWYIAAPEESGLAEDIKEALLKL